MNKFRYRIVPIATGKSTAWALKEGDLILEVFLSRQSAEKRKTALERVLIEDFLFRPQENLPNFDTF